jgi:uncharacterized protein YceH (UPF0502 family)
VKETESVLDTLCHGDSDHALVVKLPREPGKRESRYMHQFSGAVDLESYSVASKPITKAIGDLDSERVTQLEEEVSSLRKEVSELRELIQQLL